MNLKFHTTIWHRKDGPPVPGVIVQSDRKQFFVARDDLYKVSDALVGFAEAYDNNDKENEE